MYLAAGWLERLGTAVAAAGKLPPAVPPAVPCCVRCSSCADVSSSLPGHTEGSSLQCIRSAARLPTSLQAGRRVLVHRRLRLDHRWVTITSVVGLSFLNQVWEGGEAV